MSTSEDPLFTGTRQFIRNMFELDNSYGTYYHYTKPEIIEAIIQNKEFRASFIRSTSDPLEFVHSMTICRDWLCNEANSLGINLKQDAVFKYFNDEAILPKIKPFFISAVDSPNSQYHLDTYGSGILAITQNEDKGKSSNGYVLKCMYKPELKKTVHGYLKKWSQEILIPVAKKNSINLSSDLESWFHQFIFICHSISLTMKEHRFSKDNEIRYVFFYHNNSIGPDIGALTVKTELSEGFVVRTYLPLPIEDLGFSIEKYEKK